MIKKTILFSAVAIAIAGCNNTSQQVNTPIIQNQSQFEQYSAETFFDTTSIMGSSFSQDGKRILVSSDETGIFNLYLIGLSKKCAKMVFWGVLLHNLLHYGECIDDDMYDSKHMFCNQASLVKNK